jgi:hypothetical protein
MGSWEFEVRRWKSGVGRWELEDGSQEFKGLKV